ncbi:MAG: hypothetical protein WAU58_04750 [Terriglobales bacterium]
MGNFDAVTGTRPFLTPRSASPQTPAPQIAVRAKRSQNMVRPLHQQRSQVRIAFLADVHLRFTLAGVPASKAEGYSKPAPTKPMSGGALHGGV